MVREETSFEESEMPVEMPSRLLKICLWSSEDELLVNNEMGQSSAYRQRVANHSVGAPNHHFCTPCRHH